MDEPLEIQIKKLRRTIAFLYLCTAITSASDGQASALEYVCLSREILADTIASDRQASALEYVCLFQEILADDDGIARLKRSGCSDVALDEFKENLAKGLGSFSD